jgi:anaerobic ribonucleoside-triphosphate reductase activating protein
MNYAGINPLDIANGPGWRVSLFVSGCTRRCKGCFNKEAQDFNYGQEFTWETLHEIERLVNDPNVSGLSILGGDPLEPENQEWIKTLCAYIRHNCPEKTIWLWTGDLWEHVKDLPVMQYVDILVDGPFIEDLKDLRLKWKGSSNQRVINVSESLKTGEVVEYDM